MPTTGASKMSGERNTVREIAIASIVLLSPAMLSAGETDLSREILNISVMGVEAIETSTHGESFEILRYTADPIEGFNRGSLRTPADCDRAHHPVQEVW